MLLEPFSIFRMGAEGFRSEYLAAPGAEQRKTPTPGEVRSALARLLLLLLLLVAASALAGKCKDKGLNYAVVISDPLAYILGRLLFGRC